MPLTTEQLEQLREQLVAEGEKLGAHVRDVVGHGADPHGDAGDCSASLAGAEFAFGLEEHEHELLQEIDSALKRIEAGTYGVCHECGEEIPLARLNALPTARCDADCQERLDRESPGGPTAGRGPVFAKR
ncbi:MAG: TraR/DksA family transcriptional regulator [Lentisphaerae bacterium]|jgi:DnaK suppressor protein|nr:TraR/DksA family transcriptional regulator [Lentisphaerota bacterium]MBT5607428.1 TraR/DksA family transcriptional regulator [Lentisphaerota bacterium]MBT7056136.1 TraR/DksA family transcriptional regulator [Lentisphaerota bacterium]MBT7841374.1 TraR/DksA family transcriptional regulator [Lentisphaerota bacterium]